MSNKIGGVKIIGLKDGASFIRKLVGKITYTIDLKTAQHAGKL